MRGRLNAPVRSKPAMKNAIFARILSSLLVVFIITIIIFMMIHMLPGDPVKVILGENATESSIAVLRSQYNLDKPLIEQYTMWLGNVLKGDLGKSITSGEDVLKSISLRIPRTIELAFIALIVSLLISVPIGVISAAKHNTYKDLTISSLSLVLLSIPQFWMGLMLMILFSLVIPILPAGGLYKL